MEYCTKGDLYSRILENKKNKMMFPEKEVLRIFYGVMNAVKVLHELKTVHRDLCPQNIVFDANDVPKLIDFGSGRIIQEDNIPTTILFSAHFTHFPPEAEDLCFIYTS